MWCSSCQAEVAAKVSTDNSRLFCAGCGKELKVAVTQHNQESTRQAQDLLQRWSSNQNSQVESTSSQIASAEESITPDNLAEDFSENHPVASGTIQPTNEENITYPGFSSQVSESPEENIQQDIVPFTTEPQSVKQAVQQSVQPQMDIQSTITRDKPSNTNWIGFFGQILAYGGVGLLTVGTCMVLLGYFGGKEGYAPQGWLISTIGQMALLLGIVTLVSSGIEHSSNEVTNHIASLDERIMRIEQAALARSSSGEQASNTSNSLNSSDLYSAKAS